jgi:hypothetical protein
LVLGDSASLKPGVIDKPIGNHKLAIVNDAGREGQN